ncbi:hypothetical protein LV84_01858 [Algoriphagus ratkowskyi]|uniref:Uncharacterized protein n=1 Tax=Algoriphagus ratkowskyi TaxID=57028 RepID=A0A2W7RT60_9BACT|nr:hypothetical protein LV84_01858 [Algoriphagus ratkowskyi]
MHDTKTTIIDGILKNQRLSSSTDPIIYYIKNVQEDCFIYYTGGWENGF